MSSSSSARSPTPNGARSSTLAANSIAESSMRASSATSATAAGRPDELLSAESVRDLAARLVSDELVVVPVRHHSPACALLVRRLIERHQPSVVLVEGPRSFTSLAPLLTHPEAEMPLAVYTYAARKD